MTSKKHKKICKTFYYIAHLLILTSIVKACISVADFASLVGVSWGITSSAVGLKTCVIISQ